MRESITIQMPVEDGRLLARAVAELTRAVAEPTRAAAHTPPDTVLILALMAAGRFDLVAPLLRAPATLGAALPLVLARYVAWTGDLAAAAGAWQHARSLVLAALEAGPAAATATIDASDGGPEPAGAEALVHTAGSFAGMARVATDLGDPQLAALLIGAARTTHQRLAAHPLPPRAAELGTAVNLVDEAVPAAFWHSVATPPLLQLDTGSRTDAQPPGHDPDAARSVLALVHGSLGVEPDATRHRLRIRPRLPAHWTELRVRDIGFGDGTIGLDVQRTADSIQIRIRQDSGAVPVTVLLEPVIAGDAAVMAAMVDGTAASLSPRPVADGSLVPVQLVLDAERELRLQLDAQRPPT
jgi:hypothetical protein